MARARERADRGVMTTNGQPVAGTTIFDGDQAIKGYALNKMCMSFNDAASRAEFARDEDAYCARYGLSPAQRAAVRHREFDPEVHGGMWAYARSRPPTMCRSPIRRPA